MLSSSVVHSLTIQLEGRQVQILFEKDELGYYLIHENLAGYSGRFRTRGEGEKALALWLTVLAKKHDLSETEAFKVYARCLLAIDSLLEAKAVEAPKPLPVENVLDYILEDLGKRVRRDLVTKVGVLTCGVSAYLPEPINLFLKGPSGSGKTYNTTETLKYFPKEDIWFLGGYSPKALIHDYGIMLCEDGTPLEELERPEKPKKGEVEDYERAMEDYKRKLKEYKEKVAKAYTLIKMDGKILAFLESPEPETYRILYPVLSHDTKRIEYKFTDKTSKGQLKTLKVVVEGWPACVFLTVDRKYVEEASTRGFTASPEISKEKIGEALELVNLKASTPWEYDTETPEQASIRSHIRAVKTFFENGGDVIVPFDTLHELFPKEIPRDMRDFQHFIQFLKALTALHFHVRPHMKYGEKTYVIACAEDVEKAIELYSQVFETTRTGTEQQILDFYYKVVLNLGSRDFWTIQDLTQEWNKIASRKVSSDTIRRWVQRLVEIGYVDEEEHPVDRRMKIYTPLQKSEMLEISRKNHIQTILGPILEKGLKNWIKNICSRGSLVHNIIFLQPTHNPDNNSIEMKLEDVFKTVLGKFFDAKKYNDIREGLLQIILEPENSRKTENLSKDSGKGENQQFSSNSENSVTLATDVTHNISDQHPGQDGKDKTKPEDSTQTITVTSVTSVTKTCGDCACHQKMSCLLHPEWTVLTPAHPACEKFKPKGEM